MLLCTYQFIIGLLTLIQLTHTFVLLTANIEDVKKIARKFVSEPLAEKIAVLIAKASENDVANVSEENEDNASEVQQLSESQKDQFDNAARHGTSKRNSEAKATTSNRVVFGDKVSIERTTEAKLKSYKHSQAKFKNHKLSQAKLQHGNEEERYDQVKEGNNILRENIAQSRLKEKRHWERQQRKEKTESETQRPKEIWQREEKNGQEQDTNDNELQERSQEKTEKPIYKPKKRLQKKRFQKRDPQNWEKMKPKWQEEKLTKNRYKPSGYWPKYQTKTTFAPKPDRHGSVQIFEKTIEKNDEYISHISNEDQQQPEPEKFENHSLHGFNSEGDTAKSSLARYEDIMLDENEPKRQRIQSKNHEAYDHIAEQEVNKPSTITIDLMPRFNGFNIDNSVTTRKETSEFDQYDNMKSQNRINYKQYFYPRSQLAATSGNVMLPKIIDNNQPSDNYLRNL